MALFGTGSAWSQVPSRRWHIAILNWAPRNFDQLIKDLSALGYAPGQGADYTVRDCASRPDVAARVAAELVALNVDMIVTTSTGPSLAAKAATSTIPILVSAADPLRSGLVASLAQPGGNVTGVSISAFDLLAKRVEIARELIPGLRRVAFLGQVGEPNAEAFAATFREAAARLSLEAEMVWAKAGAPLETSIAEAAALKVGVLVPQPIFLQYGREIAAAALRHRLPVVGEGSDFAGEDGLLGFGIDRAHTWNRLAVMIDRVLKGAKPAELPMEQGIRTYMAVNLRTARSIGIEVPSTLVDRADEVIE